MTRKQKLLKALYPLSVKLFGLQPNATQVFDSNITPPINFYNLYALTITGATYNFASLQGKYVLIVNTASDCGFTAQYSELQDLQNKRPNNLVVLGFPSNNFKQQETGTDAAIAQFCSINFGVTFTLMHKSNILMGEAQNTVYQWLTSVTQNGVCNQAPSWNFCKYLITPTGRLSHYFGTGVRATEVEKYVKS